MKFLFYPRMGAVEDQAGSEAEWWVAAADEGSRHALLHHTRRSRRDEQQVKSVRVAVVLFLFLVLLGGALLVGGRGLIDPLLRSEADEREAKRVGEIVYSMADGAYCRHLSFDNTTGELMERAVEQCSRNLARERPRTAIGFAWGAR